MSSHPITIPFPIWIIRHAAGRAREAFVRQVCFLRIRWLGAAGATAKRPGLARNAAAANKPAPCGEQAVYRSKQALSCCEQARSCTAPSTPLKSIGSREAPITIEVFSDYQCPQCRVFYLDTARQLMQSYIPAGKVYYVHRDFPLSMHSHSRVKPHAGQSAAASRCRRVSRLPGDAYSKQDSVGALRGRSRMYLPVRFLLPT